MVSAVALSFAMSAAIACAQAADPPFRVNYLLDQDQIACGTAFLSAGTREQVFIRDDPDDRALIRIDGQNHSLRLVSRRTSKDGHSIERWEDASVRVDLTYRKVSEYEEGVEYVGNLVVTYAKDRRVLQLEGYSGC